MTKYLSTSRRRVRPPYPGQINPRLAGFDDERKDGGILEMIDTKIIEQINGYVAVAILSDDTLSTPMGAPVRALTREGRDLAERDRDRIEWIDTGPRVRQESA